MLDNKYLLLIIVGIGYYLYTQMRNETSELKQDMKAFASFIGQAEKRKMKAIQQRRQMEAAARAKAMQEENKKQQLQNLRPYDAMGGRAKPPSSMGTRPPPMGARPPPPVNNGANASDLFNSQEELMGFFNDANVKI